MNPEAIIECVPNFSEGTDAAKVEQIVAATQVDGVRLLDWSLDTAHNRSVVTFAGSPEGIVEAAVRAAGKAAELINLTAQNGVHPRIGAADVIPFIPVSGASLADCAVLARQAGLLIWRRYGVPVYFYGAAAARPDRVLLEDVRRGQFEGLRDAALRDATRRPDIGGPEVHATAGASAVGARSFLIAYNIHLQQPDIAAARAIARDIRAANGGLHGVKAIGVLANGRAQVSMNVTDFRITPMHHVHATVQHLAQRHGVLIGDAELIGLIPQAAYEPDSDWVRQITGFDPDGKVLERRLHSPIAWPQH
ncbi:glutamate formimidoyltransferase [Tunturiibacter empetritectus]|uniref:glutamate formimidoyltransferase n=1 Tax=Tunturiibacter lichenicola TaxID=2051959 RepID=A0A852VEW4_9BACT|nr:glutamate formimidoyltransferase [Edaphobacter lichenicola]NYF89781.1 glutamate formiminotransferase [Edaphobacter lichenicola]